MLGGTWNFEESFMGGYTTFTGIITYVSELNLTMTNSSPGYFDIETDYFYADNCEFLGTIRAYHFTITNSQMGSNWSTRPSLHGTGQISNSTVFQYDFYGSCDFHSATISHSTLQLSPYPSYYGNLPFYQRVNFTNSQFSYIADGVQIHDLGVNIVNSNFSNCYSSDSGGALYITDAPDATIRDSSFTSNTAASFGGALFAQCDTNSVMTVDVKNNYFADNTANLGGAIACNGNVRFSNSDTNTFEGNVATYAGNQDPNIYCLYSEPTPVTGDENNSSSLTWLWVILGVLASVIILIAISIAVICVITFVKKRRAKEEFDIEVEENPY